MTSIDAIRFPIDDAAAAFRVAADKSKGRVRKVASSNLDLTPVGPERSAGSSSLP